MNEGKSKQANDPMEELVEFSVPFDPTGSSRDVLIAVNGETIRVKRGAAVRVKRKFVEAWNHANEQRVAAHQVMEQAQEGGQAPAMSM